MFSDTGVKISTYWSILNIFHYSELTGFKFESCLCCWLIRAKFFSHRVSWVRLSRVFQLGGQSLLLICHSTSGFKTQIDFLITGFYMHAVDVPMVFELSSHTFPAIVFAPLSRFQQALKSHTLSPTFGSGSLCYFCPRWFDSSVIWQSSCNSKIQFPPMKTEKKT